ncbi:MAG: isochorismate synthase [candidate division Zixibacteria bacterium]|nr:isochorismate synthase [candidate division Zixibacteria bacterium]
MDTGRCAGLSRELAERAVKRARSLRRDVYVIWEGPQIQADPLRWLAAQPSHPSFYWTGRSGRTAFAGCGSAVTLSGSHANAMSAACAEADAILSERLQCAEMSFDFPPRFFGGFAFDPSQDHDPLWRKFGGALLVLPEALLVCEEAGTHLVLAMSVRGDDNPERVLRRGQTLEANYGAGVLSDLHVQGASAGVLESQMSLPDWTAGVRSALALIEAGTVNKIVLSRRFRLQGALLQTWPVMHRLQERVSSCFRFAFDLGDGCAFLGATPERLFYRAHDDVETECVAGTAVRGADEASDQTLATQLLASVKDKLEHYYVVEEMLRSLGDLCDRLDVGARPHVLKLATLQHLITNARGHLKPGRSSGEILASLHPTPAVGGSPREGALTAIRALEHESRGWYAGPVGWYARDEAEFAVAIRSALLTGDQVHVFAGSGIVRGSTPDEEWQETENKALAFVNALR